MDCLLAPRLPYLESVFKCSKASLIITKYWTLALDALAAFDRVAGFEVVLETGDFDADDLETGDLEADDFEAGDLETDALVVVLVAGLETGLFTYRRAFTFTAAAMDVWLTSSCWASVDSGVFIASSLASDILSGCFCNVYRT